eukprot:sb/3470002/
MSSGSLIRSKRSLLSRIVHFLGNICHRNNERLVEDDIQPDVVPQENLGIEDTSHSGRGEVPQQHLNPEIILRQLETAGVTLDHVFKESILNQGNRGHLQATARYNHGPQLKRQHKKHPVVQTVTQILYRVTESISLLLKLVNPHTAPRPLNPLIRSLEIYWITLNDGDSNLHPVMNYLLFKPGEGGSNKAIAYLCSCIVGALRSCTCKSRAPPVI